MLSFVERAGYDAIRLLGYFSILDLESFVPGTDFTSRVKHARPLEFSWLPRTLPFAYIFGFVFRLLFVDSFLVSPLPFNDRLLTSHCLRQHRQTAGLVEYTRQYGDFTRCFHGFQFHGKLPKVE